MKFWFLNELAGIYEKYGKVDEAEQCYKTAIEADKTVRNSYIRYAQFLAYGGRPHDALSALVDMEKESIHHRNWMELDYDWSWRPFQIKADAYCWLGKYDEAKKLFEETEKIYLQTGKDKAEAEACAFFEDYNWLKNRLQEIEGAVT